MKTVITKTLLSAIAISSIQNVALANNNSAVKSVLRAPAAEQKQLTFADVEATYKTINTNGGALFQTPAEAAQFALDSHIREFGRTGAIVTRTNVGNSDSSYERIDRLMAMTRAEVIGIASEMKKVGGGTLFWDAGVTNSGVGQTVIAIQDKAFQQKIFNEFNVRLVSVGLGTSQGTMNHGPSPKYGANFINNALDICVQAVDKDWIKRINGFSVVNLFAPSLQALSQKAGIKMWGATMVRGGGAITFQEVTQRIILQAQLAKEAGISNTVLNKDLKVVIQDGLPTSLNPKEFLAGKGQQVSVDIILNLVALGEKSAEIRAIVDSAGVQYEYYKNGYDLAFRQTLDFKAMKAVAVKISNRNAGLIEQAKLYAEAMDKIPQLEVSPNATPDERSTAEKAHKGLIEATERIFKILPSSEVKALQARTNEIQAAKVEQAKAQGITDIKALEALPLTAEQKTILDTLIAHQNGVRIRGMADSTRIFVQEILDLSKSYASRGASDARVANVYRTLSENLARGVEAAVRAGGVVVDMTTGKVARAPTRIDRAIEAGKKR